MIPWQGPSSQGHVHSLKGVQSPMDNAGRISRPTCSVCRPVGRHTLLSIERRSRLIRIRQENRSPRRTLQSLGNGHRLPGQCDGMALAGTTDQKTRAADNPHTHTTVGITNIQDISRNSFCDGVDQLESFTSIQLRDIQERDEQTLS